MESNSEWEQAHEQWTQFVARYPVLGLRPGRWQFHNFLRHHRNDLASCDAIRKANGKHWIAHRTRFAEAAFDCATGVAPQCGLTAVVRTA